MPYAILRFTKHKGGAGGALEAHHERKKETYKSNPDIDMSKSKLNYNLIQPQTSYRREINSRIGQAGCKVRKDSVKFIDTIITASPEFFQSKPPEQTREYFTHALQFIKDEVGEHNIFSAVIHMDEKTPHMHLCFVPLTKDNRLSAKEILGDRQKLIQWQDKFHAHMSQKWPELERGLSAAETKRKHIPVWLFKKAERLDKQLQDVERALNDITPFNAKKKRDEAMELLAKWVPQARRFSAQVNNLQGMNDTLVMQNSDMSAQLEETSGELIKLRMEYALLSRTANSQQQLLNRVPDEVLEQVQEGRNRRASVR